MSRRHCLETTPCQDGAVSKEGRVKTMSRQHGVVSIRNHVKRCRVKTMPCQNDAVTTRCRAKSASCQDDDVSKHCRATRYRANMAPCQKTFRFTNAVVSTWRHVSTTAYQHDAVSKHGRVMAASYQGVVSMQCHSKKRCRANTTSCQDGAVPRRRRVKGTPCKQVVVSIRRRVRNGVV